MAVPLVVPVNGPLFVPVERLLKFHVAIVVEVVQLEGGVGAELTTSVSDAVSPVSVVPSFNVLVVLLCVPFVFDVTVTVMVQLLNPATVIFVNDMGSVKLPEAGEGEPQPLYVTDKFASDTFAGRSSVKLTLLIESGPGLLIVNVSVEVPPGVMVLGENDLSTLAFTI